MPLEEHSLKPLKWYKSLDSRKGRLEAGAFLVEGERAVRQVLSSSPESIIEVLSVGEPPAFLGGYPVRQLTESQMKSVSSVTTPQGLIVVARPPADIYWEHLPEEPGGRVLLLEDVQDPGNTGTLIRTAAAFDYSGVILSEKCADPLSPRVVQASAGTVLSLWLRRTAEYLEMVETLKKAGYVIAAAELDGTEGPDALGGREKLVLALGNEAAGLSKEIIAAADYRVKIPVVREKAESLNVAACGAIAMYLSVNNG